MVKIREQLEYKGQASVYEAPSSSREGVVHRTLAFPDGHVECTCEGFIYHKKCWHADDIRSGRIPVRGDLEEDPD